MGVCVLVYHAFYYFYRGEITSHHIPTFFSPLFNHSGRMDIPGLGSSIDTVLPFAHVTVSSILAEVDGLFRTREGGLKCPFRRRNTYTHHRRLYLYFPTECCCTSRFSLIQNKRLVFFRIEPALQLRTRSTPR